jgi:hypothetical protein
MSTTTRARKAPAKATKTAEQQPAKKVAASNRKATPEKKVAASNRRGTRKAAQSGLAAAAATGEVKFYRQRKNQTLRFLPYYARGTDSRKAAELIQKRRDNGETIGAIAKGMNASVATIRRLITGLLLAQAVEAGDYDAKWDGKAADLVVAESNR